MGKVGLLVGRTHELGVLDGVLEDTSAGSPNIVFVTGEPGIGKTHVLAELARRANGRGYLVLEGSAAEFEHELPFGVVVDALDAYVASLERHAVDRLAADGLEELADVFPSLRSLRSMAGSTSAASERFRSYFAVRELLERLAARQPLLLVLDDLHWADLASVELVAHLLRRPPDASVLLAGGFRTGQAHPALTTAIDRAGRVTCLELGPLPPDEATALVAGTGGDRLDALYAESGGNPFYLLQLARVGDGNRAGPRAEGGKVPRAVVAAIGQELAALPPAARAFAEAAAVAGDPFELDVALPTADLDEATALESLDQLVTRDLVRPTGVPRRFAFRHPLVRAAVYQSASTSSRLEAHGRCGEALASQGAPATSRAYHVEQSARRGDADAVAVLVEAGRATARRVPPTAARWFEAALRLLPERATAGARVELLEAAAGALTTAGRLVDARAALLQGLALVDQRSTEERARMTAACANVEQQLGRQDDAHARLLGALDDLGDRRSEPGVSLMVALATDGFYRMDFHGMKDWAGAAATAASGLSSPALTAVSEAILAEACAFTGDVRESGEHCMAAAGMIDGMPDEELAVRLDAIGHLAAAELYLERFEETARHAARGVAVARRAGRDDVFPTLYPCLGTATWVLGRLDESAEVLDVAIEAARLSGNAQAIAWSLLNRSFAALVKGDLDGALRAGRESVDLAGASGGGFVSAYSGVVLAMALFEGGDPAGAAETMVAAGGGPGLDRIPGGWRANYLEVLVRCWLALGRLDDARAAATAAASVAEQFRLPRSESMARLAAADVALHVGDVQSAVDHAEASVAAAEAVSARVDAAMARILLGQALARAGRVAESAVALERAAADLDAFGATRYRDRAERELRRLGHHVHRRTERGKAGYGMGALSGREMEVACLVVDRRTNPEIAADLFLSLKTVESHMRNIFRKLEVSSRVEVARVVERSRPA